MRRLLLLVLLAASLGVSAETVEVGKVKFPTQVDVAGQRLVLSGAGIRTKAIFKVYAAALYLKAPATTTEAVLSQGGPKRIDIHMLREVDGKRTGQVVHQGHGGQCAARRAGPLGQRHPQAVELFAALQGAGGG